MAEAASKTVLDKELYDEAEQFKTAAGKVDKSPIQKVIDNLGMVRDAIKRLDENYKSKVEKLKAKIAPFDADKKAIKVTLDAAEAAFNKRIVDDLNEGKAIPEETDAGTRLTIVYLNRIVLAAEYQLTHSGHIGAVEAIPGMNVLSPDGKDHQVIPLKYFKPLADCIDWAAVEKDIKANNALIEAGEPAKYHTAFAAITKQVSLRPALAEV